MEIKFAARLFACAALVSLATLPSAAQNPPATNSDFSVSAARWSTSDQQSSSSSQQSLDLSGYTLQNSGQQDSNQQPATPPDSAQQNPGQQPAQPPANIPSGSQPADTSKSAQGTAGKPADGQKTDTQGKTDATSNDRLFFALPNFLTLENSGKVPPLTAKQKFAVVARGSFDYIQVPWYSFLAAISQAEDSEPGYGQGWEGYGKRLGATAADGIIENFMVQAVLPTVLRQDPRYFQRGKGSFWRRTWYAGTRNIVTRSDSGKTQFNYSEVFGGAVAAAISTYSYHPKGGFVTTTTPGVLRFIPSDRTLTNTGKVWGTQFGYDTITLVVKEFWPDIRRAMHKTQNQ